MVTGRPPSTLEATARWLTLARIPHTTLLSVDKYGRQREVPDAVAPESLRGSCFSFAIEDSLAMARFLVEEAGTPVLLFDRPWNQNLEALDPRTRARIHRVDSWRQIAADARDHMD